MFFTSEDQVLLSAGMGDIVTPWEVPSWELLHTLDRHEKSVNALAFSPDGRWLVLVSPDSRIRVWVRVMGGEVVSGSPSGGQLLA